MEPEAARVALISLFRPEVLKFALDCDESWVLGQEDTYEALLETVKQLFFKEVVVQRMGVFAWVCHDVMSWCPEDCIRAMFCKAG